jgi:hypothetical protein
VVISGSGKSGRKTFFNNIIRFVNENEGDIDARLFAESIAKSDNNNNDDENDIVHDWNVQPTKEFSFSLNWFGNNRLVYLVLDTGELANLSEGDDKQDIKLISNIKRWSQDRQRTQLIWLDNTNREWDSDDDIASTINTLKLVSLSQKVFSYTTPQVIFTHHDERSEFSEKDKRLYSMVWFFCTEKQAF